ncbi:MAG: CHASE2 domain-containing protein [Spirochaetaceae bacterium]
MKRTTFVYVLIPLIVAGVIGVASFWEVFEAADLRLYDSLLRIKEPIPEDENLLLLEIDDTAIAQIGVWPWSRHIIADGLILLAEFDNRFTMLDIEYTEESPRGVNSEVLNQEIPQAFENQFGQIRQNIVDLFTALRQEQIPLSEAEEFVQDLAGLTDQAREQLLDEVRSIARDNDSYFGRAAAFHGDIFFTVGMAPEVEREVPQDALDLATEEFALENVDDRMEGDWWFTSVGIRPTIPTILAGGDGAGFPNVIIDPDGVRRRVDIIAQHEDHFFGQLAFTPTLDLLGRPEVEAHSDRVILRQAQVPGEDEPEDIVIPLTPTGEFLINWPKGTFEDTLRHLSFYELVRNQRLEERLIANLRTMSDAGYLDFHDGTSPLQLFDYAEGLRLDVVESGRDVDVEEYREVREQFVQAADSFVNGNAEEAILGEVQRILDQDDLPDDRRSQYEPLLDEVPEIFSATREIYDAYAKNRERLKEELEGSYAYIGYTGTGTTDIGQNPFSPEYANVGTHASVTNTILQRRFLDLLPHWYGIILAAVVALAIGVSIRRLNPVPSLIVGVGYVAVFAVAAGAYFLLTRNYPPMIAPLVAGGLTFIGLTAFKFIQTAQERSYIRNAFSHYLSSDVISDLISDPNKLRLGGEKKHLTAFFTDVKGFSTISEKLDPESLVSLLNEYLTAMSDTILEMRGTIDKYEGDAIISFFGAPIDLPDHARRACLSAVRMKRVEQDLNERLLEAQRTPGPLLTRIGINSGEMVVGNMGTLQKMDYTMMGNAVNLAARLEGVNKQYGTWILASEATRNEAGDHFAYRKLDRVRVVGIETPVRLFEVVEEQSQIDPLVKEALDTFHEGLNLFENREWEEARKRFQDVLSARPGDGPATFFAKRCAEFQKKAPPANWDGVFNLSSK